MSATTSAALLHGSMPGLGRPSEALPPAWRRAITAAVLALHVAAVYGLLQIGAVREAVREAVPIFAGLITPAPPPEAPPPPPPAPVPRPVVREIPKPIISAPPAPVAEPAEFVVPPPAPPDAVVSPEAPPAPPAPVVSAGTGEPRTLSATEIAYLQPPRVHYPSMSRRLGEQGKVMLRVLVDPQGLPAQVVLVDSSGYPRLDEAASSAAKRARFRPYTENGVAQTVWVLLPIVFSLEER